MRTCCRHRYAIGVHLFEPLNFESRPVSGCSCGIASQLQSHVARSAGSQNMCHLTQDRLVMSPDWCLILDELTPRGFTGRPLKNVGLWTRQRPDALVRPIESSRGCPARFQRMIGRKLKSRSPSLRSQLRRISGLESCVS